MHEWIFSGAKLDYDCKNALINKTWKSKLLCLLRYKNKMK